MNDKFRIIVLKSGVLLGDDTSKSALLGDDTHQRNLFCLPRQKGFFLAFWGKNGLNMGKSGFDAVDWLLRSPIFCFQRQEQPENAGVLFAFLCSVKKEQKGVGGGSRTDYSLRISSHVMI